MDEKITRARISGYEKGKKRGILRSFAAEAASRLAVSGNEQERKKELERRFYTVLKGAGLGVAGFMFARTSVWYSAMPFGFSLLAAVGSYAPFVYVGTILGTLYLGSGSMAAFLAYTLGMILRLIGSTRYFSAVGKKERGGISLFSENVVHKVICALSMAFMLGVYRCVSGGFLYYDLFGALVSVSAVAVLTPIFCGAFDRRLVGGAMREAAVTLLCACAAYSLRNAVIGGFRVSCVITFAGVLYAARECGTLKAGVFGLVCGMGCNIAYAPMFALAGLAAGFFGGIGTLTATASALGLGLIYGVYLDGANSLVLLAPELLVGAVVYAPLSRAGVLPGLRLRPTRTSVAGKGVSERVEDERRAAQIGRLEDMEKCFSSLAGIFYRLSEKTKLPRPDEVKAGCRRVMEKNCAGCENAEQCADYGEKAAHTLGRDGAVQTETLPDYMRKKCNKLQKVISDLNEEYAAITEKRLRENKTDVFAADYEAMARLIGDAATAGRTEYEQDEELSRRVCGAAKELDYGAESIGVYGKRRKRVIACGVDLTGTSVGSAELSERFGKVCRCRFAEPSYCVEAGNVTMTMPQVNNYKVNISRMFAKKEGEEVCGDSVISFEGGDGFCYLLLSDGMGSGTEAALTSRLCGVFLEKMLRAGNRKEIALEMLNSLVRNKNIECFATIDMLEIDLITGEGCFVKSGAAPSYVMRNGSLFRIESGSTPLGITREITGEKIAFPLCDGDIVVLTSDGVAQSFEDGLWLADMITGDAGRLSPDDLCARIINTAREKNSRSDDISVAVAEIKRNVIENR